MRHRMVTPAWTAVALTAAIALAPASRAQVSEPDPPPNVVGGIPVNYVYAAQFGFGGYTLGGLDVQLFSFPLSHTWEVDAPVGDAKDKWRVRLHFPIKYGHYEFEEELPDGTRLSDDQDTLALIPGVELIIPVAEGWDVKPIFHFGAGRGVQGVSDWVLLYGVGLKTRYEHPWRDFTFLAGGLLMWAGNEVVDGAEEENFATFQLGLGAQHPLGFEVSSFAPDFEGFFVYHHFIPNARFSRFRADPLEVENQFEFGGTFGFVCPWKLWFLDSPRIGAAYRFGDGLEGVRLLMKFPF